jgi:hypothetical protein
VLLPLFQTCNRWVDHREKEKIVMNLFRLKDVNSTSRIFNERALALASWALACVAVFFTATAPAGAGDQVPFNGSVSGQIPPDFLSHVVPGNPCLLHFFVNNSGNATILGPFTGQAEFCPNLCDGSYTGTFHWIAVNGDEISGPFFGQLIPDGNGGRLR